MLKVTGPGGANKAQQSVGRPTNLPGFALRLTQTLIEWLRLIVVTILNSLMLATWYDR
jgi:hypothetical protein